MQEAFAIGFANVIGAFFRNDFNSKKWPQDLIIRFDPKTSSRERPWWYFYYAMSSKCIFDPRENF